jgi:hypothetical protein
MFTADEAATIKRFINSFQVRLWNGREPYVDRSHPFGEYTIYLPRSSGAASFPWSKLAFGYTLAMEETTWICTIYPGAVRLHGIGVRTLDAETDVVLSGSPAWVYVEFSRATAAPSTLTLAVAASEPVSTSAVVRIPLYRFDYTNGAYTMGRICNMGDVHFDTPVR